MEKIIPKKSGIYAIRNIINNKVYVGSSVKLRNRKATHWRRLMAGRHENKILQNAWNKYGECSFCFDILEQVDSPDVLLSREQYWIDKTRAAKYRVGYNILPIAGSPLGTKQSPETIAKMSESHKGIIFSADHRARLSLVATGRKMSPESIAKAVAGRAGRVVTRESRLKMSAARTGKKWSPETRAKMAARVTSEETREKNRIASTGRKMSREAVEKAAAAKRGRKASAETRLKMSLASKRRLPISEETRARIVEAAKRREAARREAA